MPTKQHCPVCGSKDNLVVWSDEDYWCYSVGCTNRSVSGEKRMQEDSTTKAQPWFPPEGSFTPTDAIRGIPVAVLKQYGILISEDGTKLMFPQRYGAKVRVKGNKKTFYYEGDAEASTLWGWNTIKGVGSICITEGEVDAMSVKTECPWLSVVSIPFGVDSTRKHLAQKLTELSHYERIFICFDNDEPGQAAVEEALKILPKHKCFVVELPTIYKDANEALRSEPGAIKTAVNAATCVVQSVVPSDSVFVERVLDYYFNKEKRIGIPTGYDGLDELIGGWRPGEVYVLTGQTGSGKSTVSRHLAAHLVGAGYHTLYVPLEDVAEVATTIFIEILTGKSLLKAEDTDRDWLEAQLKLVVQHLHVATEDIRYSKAHENLIPRLESAIIERGCKFLLFDHLTIAAESDADSTKASVLIMNALRQVAKTTGVTVLVVSHVSRSQGNDGTQMPKLSELKNSSTIEQIADCVIGVARKAGSTVTVLKLLKNSRVWGGDNGSMELRYDGRIFKEVNVDDGFSEQAKRSQAHTQEDGNKEEVNTNGNFSSEEGTSSTSTEDSTLHQPEATQHQEPARSRPDEGQRTPEDGTLRTGSVPVCDTDELHTRLEGASVERDTQQGEVHRSEGLPTTRGQTEDESLATGISRSGVSPRKFRPKR